MSNFITKVFLGKNYMQSVPAFEIFPTTAYDFDIPARY